MNTIVGTSKLTVKNQVTIPKDARQALQAEPGDRIVFHAENGKVFLTKA